MVGPSFRDVPEGDPRSPSRVPSRPRPSHSEFQKDPPVVGEGKKKGRSKQLSQKRQGVTADAETGEEQRGEGAPAAREMPVARRGRGRRGPGNIYRVLKNSIPKIQSKRRLNSFKKVPKQE